MKFKHIVGAFTIIGAIAAIAALLFGGSSIKSVGNGSIYDIKENSGSININKIIKKKEKPVKINIFKNKDIHLGDNTYPESYAFDNNPLNISIYPQDSTNIIFYDKKDNKYFHHDQAVTLMGKMFIESQIDKISDFDYSAYSEISTYYSGEIPSDLKVILKDGKSESFVDLGGSVLYTNSDHQGNFYDRHAAFAYIDDFMLSEYMFDNYLSEEDIKEVKITVTCYHGGIRENQKNNFSIYINGDNYNLETKGNHLRRLETISIKINKESLLFDKSNVIALYVLPWVEKLPKFKSPLDGKSKSPVHFRDVGVKSVTLYLFT